jgi:hypothetical protein
MKKSFMLLLSLILMFSITSITFSAQTDDTQALESFKTQIRDFFLSYNTNNRQRIAKLGGGWAKEQYIPIEKYSYDVKRSDSLVSPYVATCEFNLIRKRTDFHSTKVQAEQDNNFIHSNSRIHRHSYAFQDNQWTVTKRVNQEPGDDWSDCNEIISMGENAGATNIFGCWETNFVDNSK